MLSGLLERERGRESERDKRGREGGAEVEREKNRRARSWRGMSLSSSNEPSKRKRERTTSIVVPGRFGSFRRARTACFQAVRSGAVWQPWPKARWHGTHCPRRLLLRDETSRRTRERARVRESKRGGGNEREGERASEREKEAKENGREKTRRRGSRAASQAAVKQADSGPSLSVSRLFPFFLPSPSPPSLVAFLRARALPCRGPRRAAPCQVKTTYAPGRSPRQ